MLEKDNLSRVLHVDLTKRTFHVEQRKDLFSRFLGGTGVAAHLLREACPPGADPLGPDNPIIFSVGPLTGLFPLASKTVAFFKSPHTGNLGESHCGGRSAVALRMAGYGAVVIKGASDMPVYLSVDGTGVRFRDASSLWNMGSFSSGRIIREKEPGSGFRTIMRIGRGGENLVSYASVMTETYRHFGRLGLGAVFGSKKLKAVVISGRSSLPVRDPREYRKLYSEIYEAAVKSPVMKKYHDLGTAENILPLSRFGGLPTRNLQAARFEKADAVSGEAFANEFLGRRLACSHCPVGCIHIAALREPYEDEAYFYKTSMISYDYEPIYALGTMLGIASPEGFLKLMDRVETLGIDAMSTGVALAWATEALEKGRITEEETGGIPLRWGDFGAYIRAAEAVVAQENEFYRLLARGVDAASSAYGGEEYALAFGKNEMPGYHTGPAGYLGYLIGARHSHLDNAGYSLDQKELARREMPPEDVVDALIREEGWRQILSSLVICFFARGIYTPEVVCRLLGQAGFDRDPNALDTLGQSILAEKYRFKTREGFRWESLRLPARIFETPSPVPGMSESFLRQGLAHARKKLEKSLGEIGSPVSPDS